MLWTGSVEFDILLCEISMEMVLSNRQPAYVILEHENAVDGVRPAEDINEPLLKHRWKLGEEICAWNFVFLCLIERTLFHLSALT